MAEGVSSAATVGVKVPGIGGAEQHVEHRLHLSAPVWAWPFGS